uniref:Uncharacterized protein n=1 Tax=Caenorhabditis japonica TaxID=281687 RepID=A0A8R1IL26_CAEJA
MTATPKVLADFPESQRILNIWESDMDPADRMEQQKMGNAMKEEFKKGKNAEFSSWRPKKDPKETEKKSPILIWTSHAVVEMLSDIFDSKVIYTWNRREYLRFHESAQRKIRVTAGSFDFETIILPTQSRQLVFLIFYGIQSHLCSMTQLNEFVLNHHLQSPCIATIDLNSVFVAGGLGDLAWSDAIPSSTGDPKKIGHIQHFGLLSFGNAPGTTKKKIINGEMTMEERSEMERNKMTNRKSRIFSCIG